MDSPPIATADADQSFRRRGDVKLIGTTNGERRNRQPRSNVPLPSNMLLPLIGQEIDGRVAMVDLDPGALVSRMRDVRVNPLETTLVQEP
jgi:hypothetical protein